MFSFGRSTVLSLLYVLAIVGLLLPGHVNAKLFSADLRWTGLRKSPDEPHHALTDLLAFRDVEQDPVFEKAMHVVENLAAQSTCHQAAAAHLMITCKAVGSELTEEPGKHELLERAKSVYAVRVAVCETGEGRAAVPASCKPILNIPQRPNRELDVVSGKMLGSCLEALMAEHYYWTSYSNNRQDGTTLCHASTLESTRLEALHSYQKLAELLPEFRHALMATRTQWLNFLDQQEENAQKVYKLQQRNRDEFEEQHHIEVGAFRNAMTIAKQGLEGVFQDLQAAMASTGTDITKNRDALVNVMADFSSLRDLLEEAVSTARKNTAEMLAAQAKEMSNVHDIAVATTEALDLVQADEFIKNISELFHRVKADLDEIAAAQASQLEMAGHQLGLNEKLSEAQKASLTLGRQVHDTSLSIASELDGANIVAGRVSLRLDKVNQALTRVEKASSVLSALFALITIPCQLAEHLHLRLLAIFATPAILVSFWKPRKHSYSFMAVYVFLESVISIVAEYRDGILTCLRQLTLHSRGILISPPALLNKNGTFVALGMILLLCSVVLGGFATQPRPKVFAKVNASAHDIKKDAIPTRYYIEHRLRNGRHIRHVDERFRRAATVC